ncbi:hypothetical protein L2E82_07939 [Cichorium intybus]|uniref:Uncharacterized protein n=1 Tax=Cichorium intybus TaxID=13427 RepID=A0ACB9G639_CICIN|nr:hypothetical protein L2E82_07939 [Cichorium intybus]
MRSLDQTNYNYINGHIHSFIHLLQRMASILKGGGLVFALIILIVISSSSHTIAATRSPYNRVRVLATDCNSPKQGDMAGCGGGSGGSPKPKPKPKSCGSAPGSSRCKKGCCGQNKFGDVICC